MSFYKKVLVSALFLVSPFVFAQNIQSVPKDDVVLAFQKNVKITNISEEDKESFMNNLKALHPEEKLTTSQFFVAADRNPKKQNAALVFWDNENKQLEIAGYTKVSTGSVRIKHFFTPVGWFENITSNGSYRAEGTKNENGIRGYGVKGMRVWDFGWVPSSSGVVKNLNIDIRFQMHATDPTFMESRLGRPDSQGCLRVHNTFNKFLDMYGIIDKNYEAENYWVLNKKRTPAAQAGSWLVVFDSSQSNI